MNYCKEEYAYTTTYNLSKFFLFNQRIFNLKDTIIQI